MRRVRAFVVGAVAGALLAGVCGCGGTASSGSALSWRRCQTRFACASLRVPVSYADPRGPQATISVVELVASQPHPIGDLVLNPGGPGASGVQFLEQTWRTFPASLRARFTLVGFDPRGDGSSEPLRCLSTAGIRSWIGVDPAPTTPRQIAGVVSASKAFVHGCEQNASAGFISIRASSNSITRRSVVRPRR